MERLRKYSKKLTRSLKGLFRLKLLSGSRIVGQQQHELRTLFLARAVRRSSPFWIGALSSFVVLTAGSLVVAASMLARAFLGLFPAARTGQVRHELLRGAATERRPHCHHEHQV